MFWQTILDDVYKISDLIELYPDDWCRSYCLLANSKEEVFVSLTGKDMVATFKGDNIPLNHKERRYLMKLINKTFPKKNIRSTSTSLFNANGAIPRFISADMGRESGDGHITYGRNAMGEVEWPDRPYLTVKEIREKFRSGDMSEQRFKELIMGHWRQPPEPPEPPRIRMIKGL